MSNVVVVDDQALSPDTGRPVITYSPPNNWRSNEVCVACDITSGPAMARIYNSSLGGTWTNAWWETDRRLISASLDFQGTSVSAYFIFFFRSQDENSRGDGSLQFFIDNRLEHERAIHAEEYTFELDSSPRTLMFQQSNLDPNTPHNLRISWTNDRGRPRVAVALDSIEYTPSPTSESTSSSNGPSPSGSSNLTPTGGLNGSTTGGNSDGSSSQSGGGSSNRIVQIVAPTVTVVVVLLAVLIGLLIWMRRRRARREKDFKFDPSVQTCEGRRYPHLSATPFPPSAPAQPHGLQFEPFNVGSPVSNDVSSQITSPSGYTAYTSTNGTEYSSANYHAPQGAAMPHPPAYADGSYGAHGASHYQYPQPVRKS